MVRFGRIPFKIAKLVLDPSLNQNSSQGELSIINDVDRSVDLQSARGAQQSHGISVNQTTIIDEPNFRMPSGHPASGV